MKTIIFSLAAAKDLDALPAEARHSICSALTDYALSGRGDVKNCPVEKDFG